MIQVTDTITLQDWEITCVYVRASGPGGQNVNKVATAVQLRFHAENSPSLPGWVKGRLRSIAGSRMTKAGEIVIEADRHRTQAMNRDDAIERLVDLIKKAAHRQARRVKTKPTYGSKLRRLDAKKQRGETKKLRGRIDP